MGTSPFELGAPGDPTIDFPADQRLAGNGFQGFMNDPTGTIEQQGQDMQIPTPQIPRPAPPAPTQGTPLRDIAKNLRTAGDDAARARLLHSSTLDAIAGAGSPQTDALFDFGATVAGAGDPSEKILGSAAGTNAQFAGDANLDALRLGQEKTALETEKLAHAREDLEHGDPMERTIRDAKLAKDFEELLPYGEKPHERMGLPGEETTDVSEPSAPFGAPSYGEAKKYEEARGIAEARGRGMYGGTRGAGLAPGGTADIGGHRIQLTEQMAKDLQRVDSDQTIPETERTKRREAILRRGAVMSDILTGHGGSGYFKRPY